MASCAMFCDGEHIGQITASKDVSIYCSHYLGYGWEKTGRLWVQSMAVVRKTLEMVQASLLLDINIRCKTQIKQTKAWRPQNWQMVLTQIR